MNIKLRWFFVVMFAWEVDVFPPIDWVANLLLPLHLAFLMFWIWCALKMGIIPRRKS